MTSQPEDRISLDGVAGEPLAQAPDGRYRNRLAYNGRWKDEPGTEDCWGRALWGLGTAAARGPTTGIRVESLARFDQSAQVGSEWPHAMAFAALGAAEILGPWPGHPGALALLAMAGTVIGEPAADAAWPWPAPRLSYANAAIAEAVIAVGEKLGRDEAASAADIGFIRLARRPHVGRPVLCRIWDRHDASMQRLVIAFGISAQRQA